MNIKNLQIIKIHRPKIKKKVRQDRVPDIANDINLTNKNNASSKNLGDNHDPQFGFPKSKIYT